MKNLNKRSKTILAMIGIAIALVILIGLTITQTGTLAGATVRVITPSNPAIAVGETIALSVNAVYDCVWSSSDDASVSLVNYALICDGESCGWPETKSVTIKGNAVGGATITAKCGWGTFNVNKVTTTVTVGQ